MKKKKLPVGLDDFHKIIHNDYYFVDKSLIVKEIIDLGAEVLLLLRPRRFGKTLHLSMLHHFFDITKSSKTLFENLNIWEEGEKYQLSLNKYPVIFISLKNIKEMSWALAYGEFKALIANLYQAHRFLLESGQLTPEKEQVFRALMAKESSPDELRSSLKELSCLLEAHYQEKVYILVDEYDTPIHEAYLYNYHDEALNFMRSFLGEALKGNSSLKQGIVTGILRLAKESLFSGINNLSSFSVLDSNFNDYFGWTEEEVKNILAYYELDDKLEITKLWYNGYHVGWQKNIYNPWSILKFLQDKDHTLKPYWFNTGNPALLKQILAQSTDAVKVDMQSLLNNEPVTQPVSEMLTLGNFKALPDNALWSLLVYSGYLTAKPTEINSAYELHIPNTEVKYALSNIIKEWFTESASQSFLTQTLHQLTNGEIDVFTEMLRDYSEKVLSYFDVSGKEPERFYHALVLGILVSLKDTYDIRSNRESGYGRYDVMLLPKNKTKLAVVIEFKKVGVTSNDSLEKATKLALSQIQNKGYLNELKHQGFTRTVSVAMCFKGKQVKIASEVKK